MVQQSLVEYVRSLLNQGYGEGVIRSTLLNAGYSPSEVDVAFRVVRGLSVRSVSTRSLVLVFGVLFVLALVIFGVLKFLGPSPADLSFSVGLFSSSFSPGQEVLVNVDISNSGGAVSGLIDFEVIGPGGRVAGKTESFSVVNSVSVPSSIVLPKGAPLGSYSLKVSLSYGVHSSSKSVSFNVVEGVKSSVASESLVSPSVESAIQVELSCPVSCDDLDFCTLDSCVKGECVHRVVVPCCGNRVCESGEVCGVDCEGLVDVDATRVEAVSLASSDFSGAVNLCKSLGASYLVDGCLADVSEEGNSKSGCLSIVDVEVRDSCLVSFALKDDFSVCDDVVNQYLKNSCLSLKALKSSK